MLWDPIRYLETCPSSDGACAMVLASATAARQAPNPPAWVHGAAMRCEPIFFAGRDTVNPQAGKDCAADVYAQAGITDPRREIDVAEVYVPFSWYEPMWLENLGFAAEGEGWKLTEAGRDRARRRPPVQPLRRRAVDQPDRRLRAAPLRRGGARRCAGWRASTRSTAPAGRSATRTAAARSSSPCGSSAASEP